jgi:hypothetical protein
MMDVQLPEALRDAIERDHRAVRPLPPLWRRSLAVLLVALAVLAAVVVTHRLRPDLPNLSFWIGWGATAVELLAGILLVGLALRESVPGQALPRSTVVLAVVAALGANALVALATWMGTHQPPMGFAGGSMCLRNELLIAVPAVLLTTYLVVRALPLRPCVTGLLGGAGAGLVADGVNHLLCPISDLRHVLVWHTGAILLLMASGWIAGRIWELLRSR